MATRSRGHHDFGQRREAPRISITTNGKEHAFTLSAGWAVTILGAFALFTVVYLGATAYLLFRDELVGAALGRQIEMQHGYEDRIVQLRAQIDRISSRQLLDQNAFEAKIDTLLARQDSLREHEARVSALIDKARAQGVKVPAQPASSAAAEPAPAPKPLKASSWLDPFVTRSDAPATGRVAGRVEAAEAAIDALARHQMIAIAAVAEMAERNAGRIEKVVGRLGVKVAAAREAEAAPRGATGTGVGGPLVPIGDPADLIGRADAALERLAALRRSAAVLPLGVPVPGDAQVTSGFGSRSDPFLGVPAMHTGIDFRAETGDPIVATGAGVVDEAGRQGGYGLMVEIDHGNGVSTRFGHMSRIVVEAGDRVRAGQVIGYAGSTGRSTGPHVHYETRINGEAVNPASWLDAGAELRPVLR